MSKNNFNTEKAEAEKAEQQRLQDEKAEAEKAEQQRLQAEKAEAEEKNLNKGLEKKLAPYIKSYPKNKEFFVTSDGQVFLQNNKQYAIMHEKELKSGKEVQSFKVD